MKFLCRQEILLRILHMGTRALAAKTTLPILSGLLLETRENELYCASTDLEIGIEVKIPEVSILEPGRVVVPGKVFYEIIRHLPPGDLEVGTDGEKKALTIKGKNSFFQLHLLPDEEYPLLPERIDEKRAKDQGAMVFLLPVASFREAVRCTVYATSPEDPRPFLSSVLAEFQPGRLRLVGTDINRLVVKDMAIEGDQEFSTMIPVNSLREMANILANIEEEQFKVFFHQKMLYMTNGDLVFSTRLVDAQYPKYQQVIPEEFDGEIRINRELFLQAVERIALLDLAVKLALSPGKEMEVAAQGPELGSAYENVACAYEGKEVEVGFNSHFLLNFLKTIDHNEVIFKISAGMKASVLTPAGDESYTYVVMPLRMNA
ncbi:MAG TPA: DNA polymerase III subunit beta [Firmicutes bacterium]|jgi:DNA polymerase-3 subunit beta|nr:DNA polymerase III subunit beta [Bacillota bacterium]